MVFYPSDDTLRACVKNTKGRGRPTDRPARPGYYQDTKKRERNGEQVPSAIYVYIYFLFFQSIDKYYFSFDYFSGKKTGDESIAIFLSS
jgi:hypothetical protein